VQCRAVPDEGVMTHERPLLSPKFERERTTFKFILLHVETESTDSESSLILLFE
jgi:hypothetical protein